MKTVMYTNRKGVTYYLCRGTTKGGKPRYTFGREPRGEAVPAVPEGYEIRESVNGVVSLARARPAQIRPEERAAVETALKRHPKVGNYRVDVKGKQITVYERRGMDADDLLALVSRVGLGPVSQGAKSQLRADLHRRARFGPVLRFMLLDDEGRTFGAERWCYLGSIDDWIRIGPEGPIRQLARRYVPKLGSDALLDEML
jgi:hypothetical protein